MKIKKQLFLLLTLFTPFLWPAESNLPEQPETTEISAEMIIACQQVQEVCSKQIDLLTAILQQLMGTIQKGSFKVTNKKDALHKINSFINIMSQLQSWCKMDAAPEILIVVPLAIKSSLDRINVGMESNFATLVVPETLENLVVPDKNFDGSVEYLLKIMIKNNERLDALNEKSNSLGLTPLNKKVRAVENIYEKYKVPFWTVAAVGAAAGFYAWQQQTFTLDIPQRSPLAEPLFHTPLSQLTKTLTPSYPSRITVSNGQWLSHTLRSYLPPVDKALIISGIASALLHKKIEAIGEYGISSLWYKMLTSYYKSKEWCRTAYDKLKGIDTAARGGRAVSLENVPTLEENNFTGLNDKIHELYSILDYIKNAEMYLRAGIDIDHCILFAGPSGVGKTAIAKAFAASIEQLYREADSSIKVGFYDITNDLMTDRRPETLKALIQAALAQAPYILFIDEIHLLALQKNGNRELLNDFLIQLRELHKIKDPAKQVFILAATNHPEMLAPELFKHERFGKVILFKKPGIKERQQFFETNLQKFGIHGEDIDIQSLVLQTKDCDYGHLQQIVKDARFEARVHAQGVSQQHLQKAVNEVVHGMSSTAQLNQEEARIASIDQAGKVITHTLLAIKETIHLVTIGKVKGKIEEDTWGGWSDKKDTEVVQIRYGTLIASADQEELPPYDNLELEKLCKRHLSGIAAQKVLLGTYYVDYTAQDYKTALEIAQKLIAHGMALKNLPSEEQARIFQEAQKVVERYELEVMKLLQDNKEMLEKVVSELIKERCLTGNDIKKIVN